MRLWYSLYFQATGGQQEASAGNKLLTLDNVNTLRPLLCYTHQKPPPHICFFILNDFFSSKNLTKVVAHQGSRFSPQCVCENKSKLLFEATSNIHTQSFIWK